MKLLNFISKNIFVVDYLGLIHYLGLMYTPHFTGSVRFYCFLDLGSLNRNISVEVHISLINVNY